MSDLSIPDPAHYPHALDIQHDTDPEQDHGFAKRIPHLGHAALFLGITLVCVLLCVVGLVVLVFLRHPKLAASALQDEYAYLSPLGMLLGYVATLLISLPVFPLLWTHSFLQGIHWTASQATRRWWKLMLLGVALSLLAQVAEHFVKTPKDIDILHLLKSPVVAWFTLIFGSLIAPVFEEITFRGFLLPAFATAYDWLSLERTPAALNRWQLTTGHSGSALVLASVVSSALFAAIHGAQLHWAVGTLVILFTVSLVFSAVRVRMHSVAASALVHISYNSFIFMELVIQTGGFRHLEKLTS